MTSRGGIEMSEIRCPHCGNEITGNKDLHRNPFEKRRGCRFDSSLPFMWQDDQLERSAEEPST
jgi:hypothetical protein